MARRKFSAEEVKQWQIEHNQSMFYFNKNDANIFVRRGHSSAPTINLSHPAGWIIIAALVALIVLINIYRKVIFK